MMRYHKNKRKAEKAIDSKVYRPRREQAKTLSHFSTLEEYYQYLEKVNGIPKGFNSI